MLIVEFSNLTEGISGDLSPNLTQIFEDFFTRYGSILQLFKPADDSVKILMHLRALAFSLVIFGIDKNLKVGVVWDLIKCEQDLLLKSANENHFYWFSDLEEYTKKSAIKSLELFPRIAAMWGELLPSGQSSKVESHAFKYTGGTMTDIGTIGGTESYAVAVSANGSVIAGYATLPSDSHTVHAFRYADGVMTDIGTLGGSGSEALGISADGSVIVGDSSIAGDSAYHAVDRCRASRTGFLGS